jgi:Xaa-Pro dipeptidase
LTGNWAEARAKRERAREAAGAAFASSYPPTVRWLLCGRGRPVDTSAPDSPYAVVVSDDGAWVLFADIETSRVRAEEHFEELGFEPVPYAWHEGPETTLAELVGDAPDAEAALAPLRIELVDEERDRYRRAGADGASAVTATVRGLTPDMAELDAAGEVASQCRRRGLVPVVVLVAGDERQRVHRHPLPTDAPLGRHALVAVTAEREGLHVSLTRLVSFGPPPSELERLTRAAAEVDAAMLRASVPEDEVRQVLDVAAERYEALGFPEEWRRHHQGGITGYRAREVFATPTETTRLPASCAVAWNPSITGGAKSEDTALVSAEGVEVLTRTPGLPELEIDELVRPWIAVV